MTSNSYKNEAGTSLFLVLIFLLGLGLVQVYSTSYIFATEAYGDGLHFVRKQILFVIVGLSGMMIVARMPWLWVYRMGLFFWWASVLGVLLTFIPDVGVRVGGASRWLQLPFGYRFEPTELMKVSYPFVLGGWVILLFQARLHATSLQRVGQTLAVTFGSYMRELPRKWWISGFLLLAPLGMVLKQPDFGSFAICGVLVLSLLFVFGLPLIWFSVMAGLALFGLWGLILTEPYRLARFHAFLDPWADPSEKGFQVIQSLLSFYSGGLWGKGIGQSQAKLFFLPEAHTDFTLAVFAEEFGFIGFFVLTMLYGFVVFKGFQIAMITSDLQKKAIALGLTVVFMLSVCINVGVALGMLPTKGLTLPFLSYGGSSLLCTCFAFGCLLNLSAMGKNQRRRTEPPLGPLWSGG